MMIVTLKTQVGRAEDSHSPWCAIPKRLFEGCRGAGAVWRRLSATGVGGEREAPARSRAETV